MELEDFKQILNMLWAGHEDQQIALSNIEKLKYTEIDKLLIYKLLPLNMKHNFRNHFKVTIVPLGTLDKMCTTPKERECFKHVLKIYRQ